MPCCFDCAQTSTYKPLAGYAPFWSKLFGDKKSFDDVDWLAYLAKASEAEVKRPPVSFAGYTSGWRARCDLVNALVEDEFNVAAFWPVGEVADGYDIVEGETQEISATPSRSRKRARRSESPTPTRVKRERE